MTDEEFLFKQTEIERKKLGYGDKHKKRGSGRYVRLPSDNLTRKERLALNGEVKTWKERPYYTREEFLDLPMDVQIKWCNSLINRYGIGLRGIAKALGWGGSKTWLNSHFANKHQGEFINKVHGGHSSSHGIEKLAQDYKDYLANMIPEKVEEPAEAPVEANIKENTIPAVYKIPEKPKTADYHNIALLLQMLAGTGAKLTIEVTL